MNLLLENRQVVNLVQAMIGAVSANFRRVSMEICEGEAILLHFLLSGESVRDREEVDDIAFEFSALQDSNVRIEVDVRVDDRPLREIEIPGRVVFGRREEP